jgi:hypothetical protein
MNGTNDTTMALEPPNHYNYDLKLNWLTRALYFSAGADVQLLKYCPNYDRVKMQGIGGTVIATAGLAFFSGSYAFYTIFAPKQDAIDWFWFVACILIGIVWAALIYNLDRFIVAASGHGDGTDKITLAEFGRAIPRLLMAALIGFVIAKPLEIRIMKTEIDVVIKQEQIKLTEEYENRGRKLRDESLVVIERSRSELVEQRDEKNRSIESLRQNLIKAQEVYAAEISGSGGSRNRGLGPIADEKKILMDESQKQFEEQQARLFPEIEGLQKQIAQKDLELSEVHKEFAIAKAEALEIGRELDGLINRIKIASEVSFWAAWLLTFLLIFLEVAPILFKMMLTLSPIDYLVENQKRLSLIQRGINVSHGLAAEHGAMKDVKVALYSEVELDYARRVGKMHVDQELTELQHQKFKEEIARDIEQNPSRYIERVKPLE